MLFVCKPVFIWGQLLLTVLQCQLKRRPWFHHLVFPCAVLAAIQFHSSLGPTLLLPAWWSSVMASSIIVLNSATISAIERTGKLQPHWSCCSCGCSAFYLTRRGFRGQWEGRQRQAMRRDEMPRSFLQNSCPSFKPRQFAQFFLVLHRSLQKEISPVSF